MDVYKIAITMPDGTRRSTCTLADDARNAQRAFGTAGLKAGFVPDWDTPELVGDALSISKRHRTTEKRMREFECSFRGPTGETDSDIFVARCATHARTVASQRGKERHVEPL